MRNVALDLGARSISFCEVRDGQVVCRRTVRAIEHLDDLIGPKSDPARVVFEAGREAWRLHDNLLKSGHEPLMLDTTRIRRIGVGEHGRKNDRLDAEAMARAAEKGGLPLAHVLSPARRVMREQLGVRIALVETRTQWITTVRGLVRSREGLLPDCATGAFVAKVRAATLKPDTRALIDPLLAAIEALDGQLAQVDRKVEELCASEPVIVQLATVPGVSLVVAATFVSVIDDAGRFSSAHAVESYAGLVPSESTSGGTAQRRLGSITKQGNTRMRCLLVQSAHAILRMRDADDPLRRWADTVAERRGKRIAVIALARRLCGVLWAMWRRGTVYEPARLGLASARGVSLDAQSKELQAARLTRAARKLEVRAQQTTRALRRAIRSTPAITGPRTRTEVSTKA